MSVEIDENKGRQLKVGTPESWKDYKFKINIYVYCVCCTFDLGWSGGCFAMGEGS